MSDGGEYDNEWPSEDENNAGDGQPDHQIEIENNFYEAESIWKNDPERALKLFESVIQLESEHGLDQHTFSSVTFIVIVSIQLGQFQKMIEAQKKMLAMTNIVSKQQLSDAISKVQDQIQKKLGGNPTETKAMYELILNNLKASDQRLWFATCCRLAKIYLHDKNYSQLENLLFEMKQMCKLPGMERDQGYMSFDKQKGNLLMELFSLEIQMCIEKKETKKMKEVWQIVEKIQNDKNFGTVIEDPKVMGLIKECGAKMYMSERRWQLAVESLQQSLVFHSECASPQAKDMLKYLLLAGMLAKSAAGFMALPEATAFQKDPEIAAMCKLIKGFEEHDVNSVQEVLANKQVNLLDDPLINEHIGGVLREFRLNSCEALIKAYKSIRLQYIATRLNITVMEVRSLLSELISDARIKGSIDQINGVLELSAGELKISAKHRAMQQWGNTLLDIHTKLCLQVNEKGNEHGYDMDNDWSM